MEAMEAMFGGSRKHDPDSRRRAAAGGFLGIVSELSAMAGKVEPMLSEGNDYTCTIHASLPSLCIESGECSSTWLYPKPRGTPFPHASLVFCHGLIFSM